MLSLFVFGFYASGLYFVQRLLKLGGPEAVLPATIVFFPTLLLTIYLNGPINNFVQQLVYGKAALNQGLVAEYAMALSARPEIETLDHILASLAEMMDISHAILTLRDRGGNFIQICAKGIENLQNFPEDVLRGLRGPVVRTANVHDEIPPILDVFRWAELVVPLTTREEQIGVLALSRPGEDGYFNARQVTFLRQAAGMLAVASENITLFEATRDLSLRAQVAQEKERQRLALEIHDAPLQEITFVTNSIDHLLLKLGNGAGSNGDGFTEKVTTTLSEANNHLRSAALVLRQICMGLYPPFRDQGIQLTVQSIAREFEEKHGFPVDLQIEDHPQFAYALQNDAAIIAVSRVLSEALNNVVKHAPQAHVCTVACG